MSFPLFLEQLFNGIQLGMMLFLMAVGVTLVFGVMRIINLAHGSMFMLGGYFLATTLAATGSTVAGLVLALALSVAVAVVLEIVVLRPL